MTNDLNEYVMNLPAVDAHEHLLPESVRLGLQPDALYLFHQYVPQALRSAGMSEIDVNRCFDLDQPLAGRWRLFEPFMARIRNTGFVRAVIVALRDLYDCTDLNATTVHDVSERIRAENTPGLTDRCLGDRERITAILNCKPVRTTRRLQSRTHGRARGARR